MYDVIQTPIFGIVISVIAFTIGVYINKKTKNPFLNPLLIAIFLIVSLLLITKIPYEHYKIGADQLHYFLSPITILLAVPLYKQFELLKKHIIPILIGITSGVVISFISIVLMSKLMNADISIITSVIPKSITTPMGISLTNMIGGIQSITIVSIVLTGITGAIIAPTLFKLTKITNPIAKGIGIGTASHAVGTSKAIEMGEVEGAMSGLSIGVSGLITVIVVPILMNFI